MFNFSSKTVIVTGALQGVGNVIAQEYLKLGANVCVADLGVDATKLDDENPNLLYLKVDVSKKASVDFMVETVLSHFGKVDILINNASIYPISDFMTLSENEWDTMQLVDLKSVYLCTQSVAKSMIDKKVSGSIINIGTIDAFHPSYGHSHYSAAKAGVYSYTVSSSYELGKDNIRVNMVSPGLINRPGLKEQWPDGYKRFINKAAVKRVPEAIDIANACLFLTSDMAASITGVDIPVESGVLAAPPY